MKITATDVFVLGDPPPPHDVDDYIAALAFLHIHTDAGVTGLSEVFSVPSGVAKAVLDGPDSFFGTQLIGEDPVTPERLWAKLYNGMIHGNRRGWAMICLGAVDVALGDIYGQLLNRPIYQLLGGSERSYAQVPHGSDVDSVIPYGTVIAQNWDHASVLREQVARAVTLCEAGFRAVKLEPMFARPETVVELARQTRAALGPERMLCVDVGYLWNDVGTAALVARQLAEFDVFF